MDKLIHGLFGFVIVNLAVVLVVVVWAFIFQRSLPVGNAMDEAAQVAGVEGEPTKVIIRWEQGSVVIEKEWER